MFEDTVTVLADRPQISRTNDCGYLKPRRIRKMVAG